MTDGRSIVPSFDVTSFDNSGTFAIFVHRLETPSGTRGHVNSMFRFQFRDLFTQRRAPYTRTARTEHIGKRDTSSREENRVPSPMFAREFDFHSSNVNSQLEQRERTRRKLVGNGIQTDGKRNDSRNVVFFSSTPQFPKLAPASTAMAAGIFSIIVFERDL